MKPFTTPKHPVGTAAVGMMLILLLGVPGSGFSVFGQESPGNREATKTKLTLAFGLDLSRGNTDALGINADLNFRRISPRTEIILSAAVAYLETGGEKNAEKMVIEARVDHRLAGKLVVFVIGKPSRNLLQEIDFRLESGAGIKYDIIDNTANQQEDFLNTDLSVSLALVYEYTDRVDDDDHEKLFRFSLRPRLKQELGRNLQLEIMFFYQPQYGDFGNYRLHLESRLEFKVSKAIALRLKFIGEYNSVVPEGVEKQDYQLINQLLIGF